MKPLAYIKPWRDDRVGKGRIPKPALPKKEAVVSISSHPSLAFDNQSKRLSNYCEIITPNINLIDDHLCIQTPDIAVTGNARVTIGRKSGEARP